MAIGETGLDYHHLPSVEAAKQKNVQVFNALQSGTEEQMEASIEDGAYKSKQADLFQEQLDLAVELGLNVVIHQRDAWDDTLEIMRPYSGKLRGVFHCFGGTLEQANEVLDLDHLVSFTGIVTFKNGASVREVAARFRSGNSWSKRTAHISRRCRFAGNVANRRTRALSQKRSRPRAAFHLKKSPRPQPKPQKDSSGSIGHENQKW